MHMGEVTRESFTERAHNDPYGHMDSRDKEFIADEFEIIALDATKTDDLQSEMSWGERYIGGGGILCVTDYGRHRNNCDDLDEFKDYIREKIRDGIGSQYLKVMDDDKEEVADTLLAVSRKGGYVVVPYFGETPE